jgi:hypothetical protein
MKSEIDKQVPLHLFALRLRALVLALGESVPPRWWKTGFMNETGFRFLERLYPRTYFHAAVHAAGKAACDVHDGAVGRIGVYHLFRLPESLEADMHAIPPTENENFTALFRRSLGKPDKLMEMLLTLCAGEEGAHAAPGPRRIGTVADLMTLPALGRTASYYHCAFSRGKPAFPYFAAEQNGTGG